MKNLISTLSEGIKSSFSFLAWSYIWVISVDDVIVKSSSEIFENLFLKEGLQKV